MSTLRFPKEDEAYRALRTGDLKAYHAAIRGRRSVDLANADLRGVDLRAADLSHVELRGAYLRDADLRGVDLRHLDLEGCSLLHAKISGAFFPANLSAEEIRLSVEHGTRLRARA
jgi:uncharacterized protein YjbI with pentapeptide repeats